MPAKFEIPILVISVITLFIVILVYKKVKTKKEGYTGATYNYQRFKDLKYKKGLDGLLTMNDNCECGCDPSSKNCSRCLNCNKINIIQKKETLCDCDS